MELNKNMVNVYACVFTTDNGEELKRCCLFMEIEGDAKDWERETFLTFEDFKESEHFDPSGNHHILQYRRYVNVVFKDRFLNCEGVAASFTASCFRYELRHLGLLYQKVSDVCGSRIERVLEEIFRMGGEVGMVEMSGIIVGFLYLPQGVELSFQGMLRV